MGKSPARWIKNILLGKKSSKSSVSKGKERVLNEKEALVTAKFEESDTASDPSLILNPIPNHAERSNSTPELDNVEAAEVSDDDEIQFPGTGTHPTNVQRTTPKVALSDTEKMQQEKAAMAMQAAFRGYLARRAFWALKGIIRLQALIRGHLVRRQAVATLYCVMGIVKLQALARGKHVRHSETGVEVHRKCRLKSYLENSLTDPVGRSAYLGIKKLTANAFAQKLLAPSPKMMALHIRYDSSDPKSASSWLENWSASHFWRPIPQPKKPSTRKSQKKHANNGHVVEVEASRPKKSVRKVPPANLENSSAQTPFEFEKPKRTFRKIPSQSVEPSVLENPQIELEKIKRNLRKVHNPVVENSIQPETQAEVEIDKPQVIVEKTSQSPPSIHEVVEQPVNVRDENVKKETEVPITVAKQPDVENVPEQLEMTETFDPPLVDQVDQVDQATIEPKPLLENETKEENTPKTNIKENSTGKENKKSGKKASAAMKNEPPENNGHQSSPVLPSYMQATESAKAKLRLQDSPRSAGQDGAEKINGTRRHSLPSAGNGRITSHSPRTQRAVNSGGKTGNKSEKSLLSSRDGNVKGAQVEWKR